jgi:hypothetical protein
VEEVDDGVAARARVVARREIDGEVQRAAEGVGLVGLVADLAGGAQRGGAGRGERGDGDGDP